jgi:hypothetical protein
MSETRITQIIQEFEADRLSNGHGVAVRNLAVALERAERSEPAAASVPLRQQVEEAALAYHKATDGTGEGEYGCPGVTCPGVQRLANFWFPFIARALSSAPTGGQTQGEVMDTESQRAYRERLVQHNEAVQKILSSCRPEVAAFMRRQFRLDMYPTGFVVEWAAALEKLLAEALSSAPGEREGR